MAEESFEEKTEKASPKKLEEARKKGEVAKSKELPSVAVLLAALITLALMGSYMYSHIQVIMKDSFSLFSPKELTLMEFMEFFRSTTTLFILMISPLMAAIVVAAISSNIMQVGFMLTGEPLKPKLSKVDPIKGTKRLVSKQAVMELFKSLLKLAIVGGIAYITIKGEMDAVCGLGDLELNSIIAYIFVIILKIFVRCTLAMLFIVAIDYAFQKWQFEKKMRMTKKEQKEEFKRTEGDPIVKSRIKNIQMQMARKRMMQEVPQADVVITNPTRLAVALKYDSSLMTAPKVVAKGAGEIAKRIRDLAEEHDIPVMEEQELARSLYASVEIDQEIPPALYQAVAEVLAYIYKLKGNVAYGG